MDKYDIVCIHDKPMKLVEKVAELRHMTIRTCVDKDYNIVVYIPDLSRVKEKQYLSNLEGVGLTYRDACIDFINHLMDSNFNIRYKNDFYITQEVRSCVIMESLEYFKNGGYN